MRPFILFLLSGALIAKAARTLTERRRAQRRREHVARRDELQRWEGEGGSPSTTTPQGQRRPRAT